jgi:hypothetical protein
VIQEVSDMKIFGFFFAQPVESRVVHLLIRSGS